MITIKKALTKILVMSLVFAIPIGTKAQLSISLPLSDLTVTSPFGWRTHPVTGKSDFHNGVDFAARSDPVFNVLDGWVKETGKHKLLGKYIRIVHGEVETIYGHLSNILVSPRDTVIAGQPIAITGSTGRVTGEHLHFSVKFNGKFLDPLKFLRRIKEQSDQSLNIE
ncbi:Murein hydrolase activator NlpD precursor [Sphingobacterium thalpophilum]|uniref:Murein hydrolase activator NlpD n=2 Tax=Sphingobacterium thalpophilum TaxID=259 RepID=A0A4U9UCG6_9SPHI|nr:Murein hydrolase activator NlpD precursor [Sphingobacterium thalpophilum]